MRKIYLVGCIQAALVAGVHAAPTESVVDDSYVKPQSFEAFWQPRQGGRFVKLTRSNLDNSLYFVAKDRHEPNLSGDLEGYASFAQSHTIAPNGNSEKELPRLTANRETLLMLTIPSEQPLSGLKAYVYKKNGSLAGEVVMNPPQDLPQSDRPNTLAEDRPDVKYAENTWSAVLEWDWIKPGMTIRFEDESGVAGDLNDIDVGAENEIVLQNIRIGMLTQPATVHKMEQQPLLTADYFNRLPVSKIVVGNYAPLDWDYIVLPSGTVYTDHSAVEGGTYSGDMRENIGKSLVSMGINNANFGINQSGGADQWQPQYFNQYVVHKSRGRYSNGDITHGLSGGNGMATLSSTVGNELSHELGHAYGMGHYPGGGLRATHNQNSGWGWSSLHNRFMANFFWNQSGSAVIQGEVTEPFNELYRYNTDAMGGGVASSPLSQYTHHTGYTAKRIQHTFENTGRLTEKGYKKFEESTGKMVFVDKGAVPEQYGIDVVTLVGYYDPQMSMHSYIYPAMFGSFGHTFAQQAPTAAQCWLDVELANGEVKRFPLKGDRHHSNQMNKFHVNVARSDDPVEAAVFCPEVNPMDGYKDWVKEKYGVTELHAWVDAARGNVGDVYEYQRPGGDTEYFRLKTSNYWYFPNPGQNNTYWEFLGFGADLSREFNQTIANIPFDETAGVELDTRFIDAPVVEPAPALFIGEKHGYDQVKKVAAEQTKTFDEINYELHAEKFDSQRDFNEYLRAFYGQESLTKWTKGLDIKVGTVYYTINKTTGEHEYFVSLRTGSTATPKSKKTTAQWKYLGSNDGYINYTLNPVRFNLDADKTAEERLLTLFGQSRVFSSNERKDTTTDGALFAYTDALGNKTYYIQRYAGGNIALPRGKTDNNGWVYLDESILSEENIQHWIYDRNAYEAAIAEWYGQSRLNAWSESKTGNAGDAYYWVFEGNRHYYRLKKDRYNGFPHPVYGKDVSNGDWEYLGMHNPVVKSLVLFSENNYTGERIEISEDMANLGSMSLKASSFKVPAGWQVRLYLGENFTGGYYTRTVSSSSMSGYDNVIKSVKILAKATDNGVVDSLMIFEHTAFGGQSMTINSDIADLGDMSNKMSSYVIPRGWEVRFYNDKNFSGGYYTRTYDVDGNDTAKGFPDRIESIQILSKPEIR